MYVESITVIFSSLFVSAVLEYQIAWKLGKNIQSLLQSSLSLGLRLVCVCVCVFVFVCVCVCEPLSGGRKVLSCELHISDART